MGLSSLAGQTKAEAHNVSSKGENRLAQYYYFKSNLDHALSFLAENDQWQLVAHQHNVSRYNNYAISYHKRLARNAWRGILSLIPHRSSWHCIHRYEGSWQDDGAPYYGGLQMDYGFQRSYGRSLLSRKGTANKWTPVEQMIVAEIAYHSGRGFYPWPNTARYCGLI